MIHATNSLPAPSPIAGAAEAKPSLPSPVIKTAKDLLLEQSRGTTDNQWQGIAGIRSKEALISAIDDAYHSNNSISNSSSSVVCSASAGATVVSTSTHSRDGATHMLHPRSGKLWGVVTQVA